MQFNSFFGPIPCLNSTPLTYSMCYTTIQPPLVSLLLDATENEKETDTRFPKSVSRKEKLRNPLPLSFPLILAPGGDSSS